MEITTTDWKKKQNADIICDLILKLLDKHMKHEILEMGK